MDERVEPNHGYSVISVAVPRAVARTFYYKVPSGQTLRPGARVEVPFQRGKIHGWCVEENIEEEKWSPFSRSLREIHKVYEENTWTRENIFKLCLWAAQYYKSPLGEVLQIASPEAVLGFRNKKTAPRESDSTPKTVALEKIHLNEEQATAYEKILALKDTPVLLEGVTGSGKTEVYLELARETLRDPEKTVLILAPEIALSEHLRKRFEKGLGLPVALWHSTVAAGKRRDLYHQVLEKKIRVVLGARSAIFTPLQNVGLLVIDEEHDGSYKQEDRVPYNARDLAFVRAKLENARLVLGSATPSLDSYQKAQSGKIAHLHLKSRFQERSLPQIELIDLLQTDTVENVPIPLSPQLVEEVKKTIAQGEQVLCFVGRRGYASFVLCEDCRYVPQCPECSVSLTAHGRSSRLVCHQCGYVETHPDECPKCHGTHFKQVGFGTERAVEVFSELLEGVKIGKLDRDEVTSSKRLEEILGDFAKGETRILVGTHMLTKGHDFPNVTLVVVLLADGLFSFPDYRSQETAYQILTQVAGRAGRGEKPGKVLLQTYQPDHPVLDAVRGKISQSAFYQQELSIRELTGFPPFKRMCRLRVAEASPELADQEIKFVQELAQKMQPRDAGGNELELIGPSIPVIEKVQNLFRRDLVLRAVKPSLLQEWLDAIQEPLKKEKSSVLVDVDPYALS